MWHDHITCRCIFGVVCLFLTYLRAIAFFVFYSNVHRAIDWWLSPLSPFTYLFIIICSIGEKNPCLNESNIKVGWLQSKRERERRRRRRRRRRRGDNCSIHETTTYKYKHKYMHISYSDQEEERKTYAYSKSSLSLTKALFTENLWWWLLSSHSLSIVPLSIHRLQWSNN